MSREKDSTRFTIQEEAPDIPDSIYVADAENLRIEKLNTRVTLVAVLIPCLLVIVLAVAYLDIKNRVASTQNTGTMGVQNLSKDLESRFSSLSLKQAKLEEQLAENTKALETGTAALQVKLKKTITEYKTDNETKASQSDLVALDKKSNAALNALKKDVADLKESFKAFDEELAGQILLMAEGLKKDQERLVAVEKKALELEKEKLTKESLNVSLGIERLALKELVNDKMGEVVKKLASMNKKIDALDQQIKAQAKQRASVPKPASPTPKASATAPLADPATQPAGIEEQTIN
jgi:chromosome segregation ATPase